MSWRPRPGDGVVLDAMVLADFIIEEQMSHPTVRARAVNLLLRTCCVAYYSNELNREALGAAQTRGVRVSRSTVAKWSELRDKRKKFIPINEKRLAAMSLPAEVEAEVVRRTKDNKKASGDLHVVRLAFAASARAIVSDDLPLLESGKSDAVARITNIVPPQWIRATVSEPAPEKSCL